MRTTGLALVLFASQKLHLGGLTSPSLLKMRYTVDPPTDSLRWSVIQVASCRLLHSGDSLAAADTAASSGELSLFQGIGVLAVGPILLPLQFTGPPPVIGALG